MDDYYNEFIAASMRPRAHSHQAQESCEMDSIIEMVENISQSEKADCETPVMAYIPVQKFCATFDPERALKEGTLFPDLVKPFKGRFV